MFSKFVYAILLIVLSSAAQLCTGTDEITDEFDLFEDEFGDEFGDEEGVEVSDPFITFNRFAFEANGRIYLTVIRPVAKGYENITSGKTRAAVNSFFKNLLFPLRFVNNILQLKFKGASVELARFGCNSTVGVLGLWDPAYELCDLTPYNEDFGQTLGSYGVGAGPTIVLPFFGHSNLRDSLSMIPDRMLNPVSYIDPWHLSTGIMAYDKLNNITLWYREYDSLTKDALEPYIFFRDTYTLMRESQIKV